MRILIDLQSAQIAYENGEKSSSISAVVAIAKAFKHCDTCYLLRTSIAETIDPFRRALDHFSKPKNIRILHCKPLSAASGNIHKGLERTAELIREACIASLTPDLLYIPLFTNGVNDKLLLNIEESNSSAPAAISLIDFGQSTYCREHNQWEYCLTQKLEDLKSVKLWLISAENISKNIINAIMNLPSRAEIISPKDIYCSENNYIELNRKFLSFFENLHQENPKKAETLPISRRKLAFVSPLPPVRSGIADYSANLLPALSKYYDIDVVIHQPTVSSEWALSNCSIKTVDSFLSSSAQYDRVIYHMGNSPLHMHMVDLMLIVPGIMVLHDFYLADLIHAKEFHEQEKDLWSHELYRIHGYAALASRFLEGESSTVAKYPSSLKQIERSLGVLIHSRFAMHLAAQWYGDDCIKKFAVVPMVRKPENYLSRQEARKKLHIDEGAFVVCSFGLIGPTKQSQRIFQAWLKTRLATKDNCCLIFVGQNNPEHYGKEFLDKIERGGGGRVKITGWVCTDEYEDFLAAADIAVQLRTQSRGESSAAVMDCMGYGIPTIVNANGSLGEIPRDAVYMLGDEFEDGDLILAMEDLWSDHQKRRALSRRAKDEVGANQPDNCAKSYALNIEYFYQSAHLNIIHLARSLYESCNDARIGENNTDIFRAVAESMAKSIKKVGEKNQVFVDVSAICQDDLKTGIQRVVRSLLIHWINSPPAGFRIEPIYASDKGGRWHYRYARNYTKTLLNIPIEFLDDDLIEPRAGDIFVGLDFVAHYVCEVGKTDVFRELRAYGVSIYFVIYDLLPILMPNMFPASSYQEHVAWLKTIRAVSDGAICISQSVALELMDWLKLENLENDTPFRVDWFHLGADVNSSVPSRGYPENMNGVLTILRDCPSFLLVGTIEPRKGHSQVLAGFEYLWTHNVAVNLVMVGKRGWMVEALAEKMRTHPELNKRLFWLESISDEYLEKIYAASTCLIAASEGEGFGLPLIEAAQHQLPIIARDIPVFREVAGEHAFYFKGSDAMNIAHAVQHWLTLFSANKHPLSKGLPWLTWRESAKMLADKILR